MLFKTLVRPHLEYSNLVWWPFNCTEILVEQIQWRTTNMVKSIKYKQYTGRLKYLNLLSLHHRRRHGDMIGIYQMLHAGLDINSGTFVTSAPTKTSGGHPWKLLKPHAASRAWRQVLSIHAINNWNSLPQSVIQSPTLNIFKSWLDCHWAHIMYQIPTKGT